MFKKTMAAAGCLAVVAAGWAYAATNWQLQAKLNTTGGELTVRDKATQTVAGKVGYYNFTTSALIPVHITANTGYEISSVKKGTVAQTITDTQVFDTTMDKSGGLLQSVTASFTIKQSVVTGAVSGSGTITPTSAKVPYGGKIIFSSNPSTATSVLSSVTAGAVVTDAATGTPVDLPYAKPVKITLSNVVAPQTVTATYGSVAVSAGADKVVALGAATTIRGSISAGDTISWSVVSAPEGAVVDTSSWTTAMPSFTPTVAGTYVFKATEGLVGLSDTVEVVATADTVAYMKNVCDGCHNMTNGVLPSTAFTKWSSSKHETAGITCISCHTDGAMPTPVNTTTVEADTFKVLNSSAGTVGKNYCAKCHSTVSHITAVAPNNTCTRCHTGGQHNPATFFGYFDPAIATAHVFGIATPSAGASADGQAQTQYVTQGATCDDCHATHGETPQNVSFAESGHGKTSNAALNAFVHYDWSGRTNNGTRQNGNCDRCHTAGGFVKLLGDDPALAARLTPVTGQANNVLVCVACHNDLATGGLRLNATPAGNGQTLAQGYFALFSSAGSAVPVGKTKIQVAFPGMKNSSICIPCHSGRSTDDVFVAVIDRAKADLKNYTTIQTGYYQHAANMGQSFIGKGAFNFNSGEYAGTNGHAAVKNGASDTQGPCVGCHYSKDGADHSLEPVGYTAVCQSCHAAPFGATDVEEKKAEYEAGLAVLDALIRSKMDGLRTTSSPLETERANVRFGRFNKAAGVAADDATAKKAYGAWYNWQLLSVWDRAAFAHNPTFAKTVLNDTIDYLDDGSLNGSAAATLAASTAVSAADAAKAAEYVETPACASCHATKATLVQSGKHAMETSTHSGTCGRCHTSEGYAAFLATNQNPAGVYSASYNGSQNVSCAACHDQHGTVRDVAWAPQPKDTVAAASKEYKLCTSCHNLTNANGDIMASGLTVNGQATVAMQQHNKDWYRNIASTHYDLPATGTTAAGTTIEGYNVRFNSPTACTDCHGHEFYTNSANALETPDGVSTTKGVGTVQTEWAASGHAGKILKAKFTAWTTANATRSRTTTTNAAVMGAGVTSATGMAWEHYNWDDSTGTASDRKSCQKCHTATGSANYLTNPATYNAANNDFSHLSGWTSAKVSPQNEVLYCWGCHTSAETGALRNPGAVTTADYNFKGAPAVYPNVGASNVCITCHGGQKSGESITALTTAGNTFTNVSFVNSHYMAAAGLMYAKSGYTNFIDPNTVIGTSTYGKSLTSNEDGGLLTSTHRKLGTPAINGDSHNVAKFVPGFLDSDGPCATCHYAKGNHELEIGAVAFTEVCVNCHSAEGTTTLTVDNFKEVFIEEQAVPFKEAIALALAKLSANYGITYNASAYPYFYDARNGNSAVKDWTRGGQLNAAEAEKLMGACFNINLLNRDPAAYVHARTYARRLLYDTIDFLDDKTINMSTGATAIAYDSVKYVKGALATSAETTEDFKYLAGYSRTTGAWNTLERP
ncbi:hypothetical protein M1B72_05035 [Geomonas paludis]|uniref:Uncharacterized protein n=1 Tax=Geomonas paludis TaxID=2740185 RepID=A0A6V8MX90_9BACT|nr:hypothetical protein [Geomonas paludis]UPU37075.1 hypothetical protein M1B72_05035 [Geomonas paludis]GFO64828.1 hypothetical protein GMPD_27470 [Geomonas paludis]